MTVLGHFGEWIYWGTDVSANRYIGENTFLNVVLKLLKMFKIIIIIIIIIGII